MKRISAKQKSIIKPWVSFWGVGWIESYTSGVTMKRFYLLLDSITLRTILHSPLNMCNIVELLLTLQLKRWALYWVKINSQFSRQVILNVCNIKQGFSSKNIFLTITSSNYIVLNFPRVVFFLYFVVIISIPLLSIVYTNNLSQGCERKINKSNLFKASFVENI